jgi:hypothetical protein
VRRPCPLGTDLDRDIRMSLAGAQPKLLLTRIGGRWYEPVEKYTIGRPSRAQPRPGDD